MTEPTRRCPAVAPPVAPFERIPAPDGLVPAAQSPDTVAGWRALPTEC